MARLRYHISVRGQVQGVGFRPFVYRLAHELALAGLVGNDSHGAWIEIEGEEASIEAFDRRLQAERPPLAQIYDVRRVLVAPRQEESFVIIRSRFDTGQDVGVTPDAAVCDDCLRELLDPKDRRYRYPFINCTNCGPRYSIIESVPYDRPNTTMHAFRMCVRCQHEYDDPADRRFHAQPNACPVCGPRLWITDATGRPLEGDPVCRAAEMLRAGRIVAIKGIGGFHLACRADQDGPVLRLRRRKGRETKPFAVMVRDLAAAQALAAVSDQAAGELQCVERPIVLVPKRYEAAAGGLSGRVRSPLSEQVAPDSAHIGLLLPYAPVHHLLFAQSLPPLVMTSGNPSNEPLCCDNDEALERLGALTDAFLLHDRGICRPVDDSVVIATDRDVVPIRRARGYAPAAILLDRAASRPVLAVGGELKSAVCLLQGHDAVLSEHLGDLKSPATYRHFCRALERLTNLLRCQPACVAYDLHPAYLSTQHALRQDKPVQAVQHHHAHIVSCMAENGADGPVLGVACDGTGYGTDGAIWGCEFMVADVIDFRRVGHLRYFELPGGDAAAKQTFRPALSLLKQLNDTEAAVVLSKRLRDAHGDRFMAVEQMLAQKVNCPPTSSLGRLFDAVAFLAGLCDENGHEAQAAMALEAAAGEYEKQGRRQKAEGRSGDEACAKPYPVAVADEADMLVLDWRPLVTAITADVVAGRDPREIAARFHEGLSQGLANTAAAAAERAQLGTVALSGGCFANQLLLTRTAERLQAQGLTVLTHRRVPAGDGGLALGQAVVAAARMEGRW